jgi:hypothetical protein
MRALTTPMMSLRKEESSVSGLVGGSGFATFVSAPADQMEKIGHLCGNRKQGALHESLKPVSAGPTP